MTIKKKTLTRIIVISLLFIYLLAFENVNTMTFDAAVTLLISFLWVRKNKENNLLLIMTLFIFYCVYSIVVGEYFFKNTLGVPMMEVNTPTIYGLTVRILMIFMFILAVFSDKPVKNTIKMRYKDNAFIFYALMTIISMIGVFGVNRNVGSSYTVNTTPLYEYSSILFIFAYYSSGNRKLKKVFLSIILLVFVLQDFYLGGRITALQLMIVLLFCMADDILQSKKIFIGAIGGIVVNTMVGQYRSNYSLDGISLSNILNDLANSLFVFDTATFSYYASATHVASIELGLADFTTRITSFWEFLKSIILGGDELIGNVTRFVSQKYINNIGGGVMPTHFYFWLGWFGVVLAGFSIVLLLNKTMEKDSDLAILSLAVIAVTSPRWFLYNPLLLFRAQFILVSLYIFYKIGHSMLLKIAGKKKTAWRQKVNDI